MPTSTTCRHGKLANSAVTYHTVKAYDLTLKCPKHFLPRDCAADQELGRNLNGLDVDMSEGCCKVTIRVKPDHPKP